MSEEACQVLSFFSYYSIGAIAWGLTVFVFRNSYGMEPKEYDDRFMLYALGSVAWPLAFPIASVAFIVDGFSPRAKRTFR